MGGGFAILRPEELNMRAAARFYGSVPKQSGRSGICPVVGSFGERDAVFAPHGKRLRRHLETLDVPHDVKLYPGAGHSFMSEHEPGLTTSIGKHGPMKVAYDAEAAEDAWDRMLSFFDEHLGAAAQPR
ncbi:MAG: dienelactone hydrolase family protein [Polyangiaceae bacterium]